MPYELLDDQETSESLPQKAHRNISRQFSNLGTRALGLPGDILSIVNEYAAKPLQKAISGKEGLPYEETFLGKAIPTTEFHRKGVESVTGEYLKPKNKVEKFADDIIEDTALLFAPGGRQAKAGQKISKLNKTTRNLAKATGANIAGEATTQITGDESLGNAVKAGALFTSSIIDQPSAAKQLGNLYQKAEANLPQGANIASTQLEKRLNDLENIVTSGRPSSSLSASKSFVMDKIDKVRSLIKNGRVDIKQLWEQKKDLNEDLAKLYEIPGKKNQRTAKNLAKKVTNSINKTIEDYGTTNPAFYKPFKEADQAFGTLAKSNLISKWVERSITSSPVTGGLLHIFGIPFAGKAAVAGAATAIPYQAGKLLYRISKSPTLTKIYGNALRSASQEDAVLFNKYLAQLDHEIQKEESHDRWEIID